ncbi:hypothetical protein EON65_29985 [archaeon]|nr:MAG: hypothetical protein EON65_29985 [archaeon]
MTSNESRSKIVSREPIITMAFDFPQESLRIFEVHDAPHVNVNHISQEAAQSNTSYEYSGRHDGGPLPILKSEGPMADVIAALAQAKVVSDSFLTDRINQVYGYNQTSQIHGTVEKGEHDMDEDDGEDNSKVEPELKKKRS